MSIVYDLSVIIPAYNEEKRLDRSLPQIISYLQKQNFSFEIIVIDDGSSDKTSIVARKHLKSAFGNININTQNMGKGFSVRKGMLLAKGRYALLCDSDLSTPISELSSFLPLIKSYDVVIASRALKQSRVKTRWYKALFGRISNLAISLVVKNISDTQCGFKLFSMSTCKILFKKQRLLRWDFDFEILFLAQKYNLKIKEVPVRWIENEDSKVKISDYPKTFFELVSIIYYDVRGKYDKKK